jgi:hypothetical protein
MLYKWVEKFIMKYLIYSLRGIFKKEIQNNKIPR